MRCFKDFLFSLYKKEISGIGFGIFRIVFFFIVFLEVVQIFHYSDLIFDHFLNGYRFLLLVWSICLVFLILGLKTKIFSLLNFLLMALIIGRFKEFEYHIDFIYLGISFISIWSPLENRLSIGNRLRAKGPRGVSVLYYHLFVFVGLASIYLESCFHKLNSQVWTKGLGVWMPSSLPQFARGDWGLILDNYPLVIFLGYLTLGFELLFPFLFWIKKLRVLFLVIGFGLHLGILLSYPIPYFAIAMMSFYILLVPDHLMRRVLRAEYVAKGFSTVSFLQLRRLILLVLVMQFFALLQTPQMQKVVNEKKYLHFFRNAAADTLELRTLMFGMSPHQMFIDPHFVSPLDEIKVEIQGAKKQVLLLDVTGRMWVHTLFRLGSLSSEDRKFKSIIESHLKKWMKENNESEVKAKVFKRSFSVEKFEWEKGMYGKRILQPWEEDIEVSIGDKGFNWTN